MATRAIYNGQAPSDDHEFAAFLVEQGIDGMSLNPDAVLDTTAHTIELEQTVAMPNAAAECYITSRTISGADREHH